MFNGWMCSIDSRFLLVVGADPWIIFGRLTTAFFEVFGTTKTKIVNVNNIKVDLYYF